MLDFENLEKLNQYAINAKALYDNQLAEWESRADDIWSLFCSRGKTLRYYDDGEYRFLPAPIALGERTGKFDIDYARDLVHYERVDTNGYSVGNYSVPVSDFVRNDWKEFFTEVINGLYEKEHEKVNDPVEKDER